MREIAKLINRNASTISREIRRNLSFRNDKTSYYPHTAQNKYLIRRSYCHRGMYWNRKVIDYIEEKLQLSWSLEQISNYDWKIIEDKLKTLVYFVDPYCSWQRGTNENSNGLLREYYPKRTGFSWISEKTLKKNLSMINGRPRKVLSYKKTTDLFKDELICCT